MHNAQAWGRLVPVTALCLALGLAWMEMATRPSLDARTQPRLPAAPLLPLSAIVRLCFHRRAAASVQIKRSVIDLLSGGRTRVARLETEHQLTQDDMSSRDVAHVPPRALQSRFLSPECSSPQESRKPHA